MRAQHGLKIPNHVKPLFLAIKVFSGYSLKKRTWFEARDYCIAIGGDLLSIHSAADQQLLLQSRYRYDLENSNV